MYEGVSSHSFKLRTGRYLHGRVLILLAASSPLPSAAFISSNAWGLYAVWWVKESIGWWFNLHPLASSFISGCVELRFGLRPLCWAVPFTFTCGLIGRLCLGCCLVKALHCWLMKFVLIPRYHSWLTIVFNFSLQNNKISAWDFEFCPWYMYSIHDFSYVLALKLNWHT